MEISNQKIAKLLRNIAAAYTIKNIGNFFQIRAYENAADSIEHCEAEIQDLWQEGKLNTIPGLGASIQGYLIELFTKGKVSHFETVLEGVPEVFFELLYIPGVGPKTAQKIAEFGVKDLKELRIKLKSGELTEKGITPKLSQNILEGLIQLQSRTGRMLLPFALAQAEKIVDYLKNSKDVIDAHFLGSLRRMNATIGDLDFSASSKNNKSVVDYFCKMPNVSRVLDRGEHKATVVLKSGLQVDLLVGRPQSYGALLQHFTGSKNHNIHLRILAQKKGLSLSENGIKRHPEIFSGSRKEMPKQVRHDNTILCETEEEFYKLLGMQTPPSELREDGGEIEASLKHNLPDLVELKDIKGDLHLHSNFPIKNPSHGPGVDPIEAIVKRGQELGYEFVGISDHPLGLSTTTEQEKIEWVQKRTKFIQELRKDLPVDKKSTKSIRVLNGLEIDILGDGSLNVPDFALETLDYCIAGIHSGHRGSKDEITKRLVSALSNPNVDIISHPTNRLLNARDSSEADWEEVFKVAAKNNKIMEINSFPNRLDLRDDLVKMALKYKVKFVINTDAHQINQMDNMKFGVSVARRGWATKKDIVNSWDWKDFAKWFNIKS